MGNKQINIYFIGLFLSQAIVGLISICSYLREFTNKNWRRKESNDEQRSETGLIIIIIIIIKSK